MPSEKGIHAKARLAAWLRQGVRSRSREAMDQPAVTAPARKTIDALLEEVRAGLVRLKPAEARAAAGRGAGLIDIRSEAQRARDGIVPGALFCPRNALEWRCDPTSPSCEPRVGGLDAHLIVMCDQGSSRASRPDLCDRSASCGSPT